MLFNSYVFIFAFLPCCLLGYALLSRRGSRSAGIVWLTACSLFYYGWWDPKYLGLILGSIIANFALGVHLGRERAASRRAVLVVGIVANLALLGYFKYTGFFLETLNRALGTEWSTPPIVLPLAISFFTFQQIAYLVDAYQHKAREYRFADYSLFVTFFPQLIAGPIVHHKEMLPQFTERGPYRLNARDLGVGGTIFFIGLFKKTVIADTCASFASPIFDSVAGGATASFFDGWVAALAYTLQLYFDFSGYSDMAIGAARLFGIRLPLNFFSPYKATNIVEFWRRWHMTLSRFLRDYLYIALGGNRRGPARRYVNLFATMLLGGLWHGAGWTFVIWGGLHGSYLCVNHVWRVLRQRLAPDREVSWIERRVYHALTFFAVVVGWVFFRAADFDTAVSVLSSMIGANGLTFPSELKFYAAVPAITAGLIVAWWLPNTAQLLRSQNPVLETYSLEGERPTLLEWKPTLRWAVVAAALTLSAVLLMSRASEFIYYQF